jgi:O-6-methylguanine DNA methyltransferase
MKNDSNWIIVRIDGKIAAISTDYRHLASITARLAKDCKTRYGEITATTACFDEVWQLKETTGWEDMMLFGTDFQKKVWKKLYELTRPENNGSQTPRLISYSDFAELCQNRAGVRAVAHAVGLNPISILIPCHLVVPKEAIDKMKMINKKAEATIFKGVDLCLNTILKNEGIDFGNYAMGPGLKRKLISMELTGTDL